ncbi:MAG: type I DNA topoisomerase [Candidatus Melainabacteria bacterium]|nr:type I DNA topoisomerase [Candidatus Melainabacteria bacterium]MBI3309297.1 type I DNA topoisomerase [Candidatus Melainabacteria bacterium]
MKSKTSSKKSLVIVESPGKVKTISKFLGKDFLVRASVGHIRDLPIKGLGIDIKNGFEPVYEILKDKAKIVKELKELAKKSDMVFLAPDPDREGEAIAWHLFETLDTPEKTKRIVCNEITKDAILNAIKKPRKIDKDLVAAQQARRILDRLVGYKISPLLWRKVGGKSAGRVQSVALRLVMERENEINGFTAEEYWTIHAELEKKKIVFPANLYKWKDKTIISPKNKETKSTIILKDKETIDKITKGLKNADFIVTNIDSKNNLRNPQPPFITSTLQRAGANTFGYTVKKVMKIAQELYEGIEMGEEGPIGLITYMRTDSTRIANEAQDEAKDYILKNYGNDYYPSEPRIYTSKKKNVQDAHEAIRPTSVFRSPGSVKAYLNPDQYKVYRLIWERFLASQMASTKLLVTKVEITAEDCIFHANSTKILFDGFLKAFEKGDEVIEEEEEYDGKDKIIDDEFDDLPELKIDEKVALKELNPKQHFTEPPSRFNEASLVKRLEELGIGRPSTYASTLGTIIDRKYVHKLDKKALAPTKLGEMVTQLLINHFPKYLDYDFTAKMEAALDDIEEAKQKWNKMLADFYSGFSETLKKAQEDMKSVEIKSEHNCPKCGKPMVLKGGRFGPFLGCSNYPECKTVLNLKEDGTPLPKDRESDEKCPQCNTIMLIKHGPYGEYLQCSNDDCKHRMTLIKAIGVKCNKNGCEGEIIEKRSRRGKIFYGCSMWGKTKCDNAFWNKPVPENCPECDSLLTFKQTSKATQIACSKKECDYKRDATEEDIKKYSDQKITLVAVKK